jgi:hypothetical protein
LKVGRDWCSQKNKIDLIYSIINFVVGFIWHFVLRL